VSHNLTYLRGGFVAGSIGGRAIQFAIRPAQTGSQLPPGNYDIHPPVNDPIYGNIALMTLTGGGPAAPALPAIKSSTTQTQAALHAYKMGAFHAPVMFKNYPQGAQSAAMGGRAFVLSSRPILGQNNLVITTGFADLMDALHAAGGATITVS
jgi:hypothetical protein